jgi:Arc/MetJ-type ribon-helix-helix transcriptional regulator
MITIDLPNDVESSIRAELLSGRFASVGEALAVAWRSFLRQRRQEPPAQEVADDDETSASPRKPTWEEIEEITASVPDEEFEKLPVDGAEQHDHYIYGIPKRSPPP